MAQRTWQGDATAVAQVHDYTPANVEIGDVFKIDLSNDAGESHEISYTATAATVQDVVEGLKAAADSASTAGNSPWDDVTATEDDTKLTLTADTAGVPFYATTTATDGGGTDTQTLSESTDTASAGPNDWNTAENWTGATVPVSADDVDFDGAIGTADVLYGLDQSAVSLASFIISKNYDGKIGQSDAALQVEGATTGCAIGRPGSGDNERGSTRVNIDFTGGTNATDVVVHATRDTSADSGFPACRLVLGNSSSTLRVLSGDVGLGVSTPGETTNADELNVVGGSCFVGTGATIGTRITVAGGSLINLGAASPETIITSGTYSAFGSAAHTTLEVRGGRCDYRSDGTITTLDVSGEWSTEGDPRPKTVTNATLRSGGSIRANTGNPLSVTWTNGIDLDQTGLADVTVDLGSDLTITPSAI